MMASAATVRRSREAALRFARMAGVSQSRFVAPKTNRTPTSADFMTRACPYGTTSAGRTVTWAHAL